LENDNRHDFTIKRLYSELFQKTEPNRGIGPI